MKIEITGKVGEGKTTLAQLIIRAVLGSRKNTKIDFKDGETAIIYIENFKNVEDPKIERTKS